jgi:hypothetical protein
MEFCEAKLRWYLNFVLPAGARGYVLLANLRCISIENYEKVTKYLIFS